MLNFNQCKELLRDKIIVCEEKKSRISFINTFENTVTKIRIDGCVIKVGIRCDYLIITEDNTEHYVELKGSDLKKAFKQIVSTIKKVSKDVKKQKKHSFIISTRCPLLTPEIQNMKKNMKNKYNSSLTIKNRQHDFEL